MRVLLTGTTGYIGRRDAAELRIGDGLRKIEKSEDGCASLVKYRLAPGIEYSLTQA
jgi:nucleoside-diphosphate-sugar epimerase